MSSYVMAKAAGPFLESLGLYDVTRYVGGDAAKLGSKIRLSLEGDFDRYFLVVCDMVRNCNRFDGLGAAACMVKVASIDVVHEMANERTYGPTQK